jgi:hypothetical protein
VTRISLLSMLIALASHVLITFYPLGGIHCSNDLMHQRCSCGLAPACNLIILWAICFSVVLYVFYETSTFCCCDMCVSMRAICVLLWSGFFVRLSCAINDRGVRFTDNVRILSRFQCLLFYTTSIHFSVYTSVYSHTVQRTISCTWRCSCGLTTAHQ